MRKVATVFLILLFVFVSHTFCGCSRNTTINNSIALKYYTYYEDPISDLINKYNNYCALNYDDTYKIEIIKFESQEKMNIKMQTEIMAGEGPDIFSLSQNLPFEKLLDSGTIADINKYLDLYNCDIGLTNCNCAIMDGGVIDGKRYFVPITFSPDIFISTEETLNKYYLKSSDFSYKSLSEQVLNKNEKYSLFGSESENIDFFYTYLDQYFDYSNDILEFNTNEFSENLDYIYDLINNDSTDENNYYFLYENIKNGDSIFYKEFSSFRFILRTYAFLYYLDCTPVFINNYNKCDSIISASVDLGVAFNNNCKEPEKILAFIKYCLSERVQEDLDEYCSLPVNNNALKDLIDETDQTIDFDDNGSIDEKEELVFKNARNTVLESYMNIISNIKECKLYSYDNISQTYFNSSVIGDIVDNYLNGEISKEKFIRQLTAATEIYMDE